jgi:hypothetical protein
VVIGTVEQTEGWVGGITHKSMLRL